MTRAFTTSSALILACMARHSSKVGRRPSVIRKVSRSILYHHPRILALGRLTSCTHSRHAAHCTFDPSTVLVGSRSRRCVRRIARPLIGLGPWIPQVHTDLSGRIERLSWCRLRCPLLRHAGQLNCLDCSAVIISLEVDMASTLGKSRICAVALGDHES